MDTFGKKSILLALPGFSARHSFRVARVDKPILGADFFRKHSLLIDIKNNCLRLPGGGIIDSESTASTTAGSVSQLCSSFPDILAKFKLPRLLHKQTVKWDTLRRLNVVGASLSPWSVFVQQINMHCALEDSIANDSESIILPVLSMRRAAQRSSVLSRESSSFLFHVLFVHWMCFYYLCTFCGFLYIYLRTFCYMFLCLFP